MQKQNEPIVVAQIMGKWLGGGVESVIMNYYRNIDRNKVQFDFICDSDSTDIPYDEINKLGGKVILVPPYQKIFAYIRELKKIFRINKYKIVHSNINTLSVFPLYAAWRAKIPIRIAHSHSTSNNKEWKKHIIKNMLKPFSKMYATNYFACSEYAAKWLFGDKKFNDGKVTIINNAVDLEMFKYNKEIRRQKRNELNIDDKALVIGHIGRFVSQKNHTFLIDVFNEIRKANKNSILILIGQGPKVDEIKNKVKELNIEKSVLFLGQRKDVSELYQAFDVLILPSLYEGLPVVGIEAQATGNLCYFSNNMTKETKILDSTVFMSLNEGPSEWARCILKSEKEYKKYNTTKEISDHGFNIKKEAKKIEQIYLEAIKPVVLHVTNSTTFSGLESVACDIIKETKDNYNGIYVTKNGQIIEILKEKGIKFCVISKLTPWKIKKICKENNAYIVHAHDYKASCICAMAHLKIKILSHLHNNSPWLKKICPYSILYLLCSHDFDKILTVSKSIENEYIFSKYIKKKIICIGNPISRSKILSMVSKPETKKIYDICCVARLTAQKNYKRFVDIIFELKQKKKNIKCIWIGQGELYAECKNYIDEKKLNNNITMLGFKKNPYEYIQQSKIFMLTSSWEGYGLVAFEALTLGLPCIVSNVGGLPDIVNESCGKLCNCNEDFIEEALCLLDNNEVYNMKSTKAIERSIDIENMEKYIKKIKKIYN